MRLSICIFLYSLYSILCCVEGRDGIRLDDNRVRLSDNGGEMIFDRADVDTSWIRVPWSNGGYYYHNTLTGEDRNEMPNCLDKNCKWSWDN